MVIRGPGNSGIGPKARIEHSGPLRPLGSSEATSVPRSPTRAGPPRFAYGFPAIRALQPSRTRTRGGTAAGGRDHRDGRLGGPGRLGARSSRASPGSARAPCRGRMGITVTAATAEQVTGSMPVDGNIQPYGLLHGGASCVLAETLGSLGAALHGRPRTVRGRHRDQRHAPPRGDRRRGHRRRHPGARRADHRHLRDRDQRRPGPPGLLGPADLPAPRPGPGGRP